MGLDNSIEVKRTPKTEHIIELNRFNLDWDKEHKYDFSVCYWRKCYNIRNDIFNLGPGHAEGEYPLTAQNIDQIIELLKSYNSKNWQENGGSIWDWDDEEYPYSEKIQRDIENLKNLQTLMEKYDLEVYFYDSY